MNHFLGKSYKKVSNKCVSINTRLSLCLCYVPWTGSSDKLPLYCTRLESFKQKLCDDCAENSHHVNTLLSVLNTLFLAATKQLYEWFSPSVRLSVRPSVRPSVCHTFLTMFPSSYHHEIFRSYYQWQKWRPCKRSRSEVKGQGHRGHNPT